MGRNNKKLGLLKTVAKILTHVFRLTNYNRKSCQAVQVTGGILKMISKNMQLFSRSKKKLFKELLFHFQPT